LGMMACRGRLDERYASGCRVGGVKADFKRAVDEGLA
jgi:hypothetical protein